MIDTIKNSITGDKEIQVVGITLGEQLSYNVLHLRINGNELSIKKEYAAPNFDELIKKLNKRIPLVLSFQGSGIITKKTTKEPDYLSKLLMGRRSDDFLFYEFHQADKSLFVSLIRKSEVLEHIDTFNKAHFMVIDYSIGPIISAILSSIIKLEAIPSHNTLLSFSENRLATITLLEHQEYIFIGDNKLSNEFVPLFASGLNFYFNQESIVYEDILQEHKKENTFKKVFEKLGVTVLALFFFGLLASYLLLGYYNDKIVEANASLSMVEQTAKQIEALKKDRDEKKEILNQSGVLASNYLYFYSNEITSTLPQCIVLDHLGIFSPEKKIKDQNQIELKTNTLTIRGKSTSNVAFNRWYKNLIKKEWVGSRDLIVYTANKDNLHDFIVEIKTK